MKKLIERLKVALLRLPARLRALSRIRPYIDRIRFFIQEQRKQILVIGGYIAYGLALFLFFAYLTFPFNDMRGRVESLLEDSLLTGVSIKAIEPSIIPGLILKGITISNSIDGGGPAIRIDKLRIRIGLLPLLWGSYRWSGKMSLYGGQGWGRVKYRRNFLDINMDFKGINLEDMDYTEKRWGLKFKGALSAGIKFTGSTTDASQLKGKAYLSLKGGGMGESSFFSILTIPAIDFEDTEAKMVFSSGRGVLEEFHLKGKDVDCVLSGDIILQSSISQSLLGLKGRFKLSESFAGSFSSFLPYVNLQKDGQGYYLFSITGSLSAPWFKN